MIDETNIPKDRIAVLIGKKGAERRRLERKIKVNIRVNSKDGAVTIEGDDGLRIMIAKNVIKAIARGFNPEIAERLINEEYILELLEIKEYSGKSKKKMTRLKGRVIGKEGRAWKNIEKITNTNISVYGKTVGIIGKIDNVLVAKEAVEALLEGAPHGPIYKWMEDKKRKNK